MRVDAEDHLLVRMPYSALSGLQVDPGLVEHGAERVPVIMTADADLSVRRECSACGKQRFMLPGLAPPPALDAAVGHGGEQIVVARYQLTQLRLADKTAVTISRQHLPVPPCQNGLQLRQQRNIPDSGVCLGGAQLRNGAIVPAR